MRSKQPLLLTAGLTFLVALVLIVANSFLTGFLLTADDSGAPMIMPELKADPAVDLQDRLILFRSREDGSTVMVEYQGGINPSTIKTQTGGDGQKLTETAQGEEAKEMMYNWYLDGADTTSITFAADSQPPPNAISAEEAVRIAKQAVTDTYALKQEMFSRFTISVNHRDHENKSFWWVNFYPVNPVEYQEIGCYSVWLNDLTGEVTAVKSAADGLG